MRGPIFLLLGWLVFASYGQAAQDLLERYENVTPFHEYTQFPMPSSDKVCEGEGAEQKCRFTITYSSKLLEDLLADTAKGRDTFDANFLATPLGKQYQRLKRFLEIYQGLKGCHEDAAWGTGEGVTKSVDKLSANLSEGDRDENCSTCFACYEESKLLSNDFLDFSSEFEEVLSLEENLESDLILQVLKESVKLRVAYAQKFRGEDIAKNSFQKELADDLCRKKQQQYCNGSERGVLERVIREQAKNLKSQKKMSAESAAEELNRGIVQINEILTQYNQKKKQLEEQWKQEDEEQREGKGLLARSYLNDPDALARKQEQRRKYLKKLKTDAYKKYREQYAALVAQGEVGTLLQMDVFKQASNLNKLDERAGKLFWLLGSQEKILKKESEFPLLTAVDTKIVDQAMDEAIARSRTQVQEMVQKKRDRKAGQDYLLAKINEVGMPRHSKDSYRRQLKQARQKSLREVFSVYPPAAGQVLFNNPQYTGAFCEVAKDLSLAERNHIIAETTLFIGLGVGVAVAGVMSAGTLLPASSFVMVALGVGAVDYTYHRVQGQKKLEQQEKMLNAYLAHVKDTEGIDEIRDKWQQAVEYQHYAFLGVAFAGIDFIPGLGPASKGVRGVRNLLRLTRGIKRFDPKIARHQALLDLVAEDSNLEQGFRVMLKINSRQDAGRILDDISKLPADRQREAFASYAQKKQVLGPRPMGIRGKSLFVRETIARAQKNLDKAAHDETLLQAIRSKGNGPLSSWEIIDLAKASKTKVTHDKILLEAAQNSKNNLSIQEIKRIAKAGKGKGIHDRVLLEAINPLNHSSRSVEEIEILAQAARTNNVKNDMLLVAKSKSEGLSLNDFADIAKQIHFKKTRNQLIFFAIKQSKSLTVADAIALARMLDEAGGVRAQAIIKAVKKMSPLRPADVVRLAEETSDISARNQILLLPVQGAEPSSVADALILAEKALPDIGDEILLTTAKKSDSLPAVDTKALAKKSSTVDAQSDLLLLGIEKDNTFAIADAIGFAEEIAGDAGRNAILKKILSRKLIKGEQKPSEFLRIAKYFAKESDEVSLRDILTQKAIKRFYRGNPTPEQRLALSELVDMGRPWVGVKKQMEKLERGIAASQLLERSINARQALGLQKAYEVGRGQLGKDGRTPASIGNYGPEQLERKDKFLREAGFSAQEIKLLTKAEIVGERQIVQKISDRVKQIVKDARSKARAGFLHSNKEEFNKYLLNAVKNESLSIEETIVLAQKASRRFTPNGDDILLAAVEKMESIAAYDILALANASSSSKMANQLLFMGVEKLEPSTTSDFIAIAERVTDNQEIRNKILLRGARESRGPSVNGTIGLAEGTPDQATKNLIIFIGARRSKKITTASDIVALARETRNYANEILTEINRRGLMAREKGPGHFIETVKEIKELGPYTLDTVFTSKTVEVFFELKPTVKQVDELLELLGEERRWANLKREVEVLRKRVDSGLPFL